MDREPMNNFDKKIVVIASLLGAITIAIGAFGAHGLKKLVAASNITSFETGVRYQMYHVLALLMVGWIAQIPHATKKWTVRFFLLGILCFSGSIYVLALKDYLPISVGFLGPVTPLGGLLFILGWLRLGYGMYRKDRV
ncbi:MAG: DUF423 domain-containing protein [Flavobacteriaceae bacterium]